MSTAMLHFWLTAHISPTKPTICCKILRTNCIAAQINGVVSSILHNALNSVRAVLNQQQKKLFYEELRFTENNSYT